MKVSVIKTQRQHKAALKAIDSLWNTKPGTPRGDMLELWTPLVEVYEEKRHAIAPPHPIEAIKFRMKQEGLSNAALAKVLGGRNRVSEVINKKRGFGLSCG